MTCKHDAGLLCKWNLESKKNLGKHSLRYTYEYEDVHMSSYTFVAKQNYFASLRVMRLLAGSLRPEEKQELSLKIYRSFACKFNQPHKVYKHKTNRVSRIVYLTLRFSRPTDK